MMIRVEVRLIFYLRVAVVETGRYPFRFRIFRPTLKD
jgi:hypothetical protein